MYAHGHVHGCVCEREHVHRFTHIGMCMCLVLEAFEHGHVCVGKRERVVRCMHMGM